MQAPVSLSSEQFATLQSVYCFLEAVTNSLDNQSPSAFDAEVSHALKDFGKHCISKMQSSFPAIAEWRALGGGQ